MWPLTKKLPTKNEQLQNVVDDFKLGKINEKGAHSRLWDICTGDHSLPNLKTETYFEWVEKLK